MLKLWTLASATMLVTSAQAAPPLTTPVMPPPAVGSYCAWGSGVYSSGARICVSPVRLLICVNGEWRVDETRTPFTEDVCRQDNPRAPVFGK